MTRNLNFLPQDQGRLGLLQAGTLVALIGCGIMTGLALRGGTQRTATISDTLTPMPTPTSVLQHTVTPKALSENPVNSVALGTGDAIRYYEQQTGLAFSVDLATQRTSVLSTKQLVDFAQAVWIPQSTQVVVSLKHPSGTRYQWIDQATGESGFVGSGAVVAVAPSPDGRSLAYAESSGDTSTIFIGASDGSSPKKILETRAKDIRLTWSSADMLLLDSKRDDKPGRDLATVDLSGNLNILMTNRENLDYQWSPDASRLLFSYFSTDQGVSLWYRDMASGTERPLGILTSARKCAWHSDSITITCGVPAGSSLTSDVSADHSATRDDVVTIDILSGLTTKNYTATSAALLGVIDPVIPQSGTHFVFTNLFDKRLYTLPL